MKTKQPKLSIFLLIVFILAFILFSVNHIIYRLPNKKGFSLQGRMVLVKENSPIGYGPYKYTGSLALITYDKNNKPKREEIPNSQNAYLRLGILPNGSVIWSDVSDGKNYKIWKYENGMTTMVKSLLLFSEANIKQNIEENDKSILENNASGYAYDGNLISLSDNKIAILEKIISSTDRATSTEVGLRVHLIDLVYGQDTYKNLLLWPSNSEYYQDSKLFPIQNKNDKAYFLGIVSKNSITDINGMNQITLDSGYPDMVSTIGISYLSTSTMIFSGRILGSDYEQYRNTFSNTKLICDITKDYGCVIHLDNPDLVCPQGSSVCPPSIAGQRYLDPEGKTYVNDVSKDWKYGLCDEGQGFSFVPQTICLSFSKHSLVKYVNNKLKTIFAYNELAFPTRHRDLKLTLLSQNQDLAIAEIYPFRNIVPDDYINKPVQKLTYAFDVNTGKSALLTDNPTDKVLYVK